MKSSKIGTLILILALVAGCGGGGGGGGSTAPTPLFITVSPTNPSISIGSAQQFTAAGTFANNSTQNLTTSVNWTSSAPAVASIGTTGIATALEAGTTTITAQISGISTATTLTVTPAVLQSILIRPANQSVAVGATEQFTATGTYADNSAKDLTASVNWTSSAPAVASLSNAAGSQGLATANAAGTATITATAGAVSSTTTLAVIASGSANNEMLVTVNGALCSANTYPNKPCVSVTVCAPGTSTCETINDILLDTGSYGLRIFRQVLTVLPAATGTLAECVQFGDGTSVWGPVQTADVILGNEPKVTVPIQVVDSTFGSRPPGCANADPNPATARFNGILGVGLFTHDCGTGCANSANNGIYYSCGPSCSGTTVPLASQVQNPAALLPQDNNGVLVQLPSVPLGGTSSINGKLILGIGTQANNVPSSVTAYAASTTTGEFTTRFGGSAYISFLDSGSNGLLFTPPSGSPIASCTGSNTGWFCPASTTSFSATNTGAFGTPSGPVPFQIGNFTTLTTNSANQVFIEIGGPFPQSFDWGLPFFYGRNVFVGYGGSTSSLGNGPYWAY